MLRRAGTGRAEVLPTTQWSDFRNGWGCWSSWRRRLRQHTKERLQCFTIDEPQADPAALSALFICTRAREHGITVLLSGAGGDDIFTGYRRHVALQ